MGQKYYAVQKGVTPGIYETWQECEDNVKGVPGAVYKSFKTYAEAEAFLGKDGYDKKEQTPQAEPTKKEVVTNAGSHDFPIAFVDGSFLEKSHEYSYGVVFVEKGEDGVLKETHLSGKESDERTAGMRNVAGEILAAKVAIDFCIFKGYKQLTVLHDYEGIGKWGRGEWKTKTPASAEYVLFVLNARDKLDISFQHVKGHSGDYGNELADALAKDVLGIPQEKQSLLSFIHPTEYLPSWKAEEKMEEPDR